MLVTFEKGRNGDSITFIDGIPAFPPKGSVNLGDADSQAWEVEIEGKNAKGTCYFLKLIRRFGVDITEITGKVAAGGSCSSWVKVVAADAHELSKEAIHPMQYAIVERSKMDKEVEEVWHWGQIWRFRVENNSWGGGRLIPVELIKDWQ